MIDPSALTTEPALSIIVPVYGVEDFVGDCLDSILDAPGFAEHCELIVVDDGSKDGSMDIVVQRCHGFSNVTIIRQENAGLGAARNTGIKNARGRYLWFVDSDDEICADATAVLVDCIRCHAPEVIAFEFETIGDQLDLPPKLPVFDQVVDPVRFMTFGRPPSPVQFYVFERSMISRSGHAFKEGIYHEDALFTPLALAQASSLVRLSATCYRYRRRPGSIMSLRDPKKHLADMLTVAEELGYIASQEGIAGPGREALAREVGFALAAARYYSARVDSDDRARVAPFGRLATVGIRWARYFPFGVFINYLRLLMLSAFSHLAWAHVK